MTVFELMERAKSELENFCPIFNEQTETVLGILRSSGCVPYKRTRQNGKLHKLLASALVVSYRSNIPFYINTRKVGTFHSRGYTTQLVSWFDNLFEKGLIHCESKAGKAEGNCTLSKTFTNHLNPIGEGSYEPNTITNKQSSANSHIPVSTGFNNAVTATI